MSTSRQSFPNKPYILHARTSRDEIRCPDGENRPSFSRTKNRSIAKSLLPHSHVHFPSLSMALHDPWPCTTPGRHAPQRPKRSTVLPFEGAACWPAPPPPTPARTAGGAQRCVNARGEGPSPLGSCVWRRPPPLSVLEQGHPPAVGQVTPHAIIYCSARAHRRAS